MALSGALVCVCRFTPTSEVALCGHATLAAAHTLVENGFVRADLPVVFETKHSGELVATYLDGGLIQLAFPATPVAAQALSPTDTTVLIQALSIQASDILFVGRSLYDLVVEVTPAAFHGLRDIQFSDLGKLGGRGVVVTTAGRPLGGGSVGSSAGDGQQQENQQQQQPEFDFFSRCFFPA
jgi:predicted PhzF superfamily epimerase YddE/YHI9